MINPNNVVNFVGRLASEPETKEIGKGKDAFTTVKFQVAIERILSKAKREEAKNDDTIVKADFPFFDASGATADFIADFFHKGDPISIACTYVSFKYQDKAGNDVYGHNFHVEGVSFVPAPPKDKANGGKSGNRASRRNNDEDDEQEDERPARSSRGNRSAAKPGRNGRSNKPKPEYDDEDLEGIDDGDIPF